MMKLLAVGMEVIVWSVLYSFRSAPLTPEMVTVCPVWKPWSVFVATV